MIRTRKAWSLLIVLMSAPLACSVPESSLPFIADDYTAALAEARERGAPLFIEAWAPW